MAVIASGIAACVLLLVLFVHSSIQESEETAATAAFLEKGKGLFFAVYQSSTKEIRAQLHRGLFDFLAERHLELKDIREFSELPKEGILRPSFVATIWKGKAHYCWAALYQVNEVENRVEMFVCRVDSLVPSQEEVLRGKEESKVILAFRLHD